MLSKRYFLTVNKRRAAWVRVPWTQPTDSNVPVKTGPIIINDMKILLTGVHTTWLAQVRVQRPV